MRRYSQALVTASLTARRAVTWPVAVIDRRPAAPWRAPSLWLDAPAGQRRIAEV